MGDEEVAKEDAKHKIYSLMRKAQRQHQISGVLVVCSPLIAPDHYLRERR